MAQRDDPAKQALLVQQAIGNQATLRLSAARTLTSIRNASRGDQKQEALAENMSAREAPSGVSWDFSKNPLFPADRTTWSQPSLLPTIRPLSGAIQAKLVFGSVDDPLEREADLIADHVMRMPDPYLSVTPALTGYSRKFAACEQEATQNLHAKSAEPLDGVRDSTLDPVRQLLRSPGQPLDPATFAFFEPRFGRDFIKVRVHTDPDAAASVKAVNAQAYTIGSDLVFGAGRYGPAPDRGRQLLAHELTHFLQQRDSAPVLRRFGDPSQAPAVLSCPIADVIFPATDFLLFPNNVSELTPGQRSSLNAFTASWHAQGGRVPVRIDGFASEPGDQAYNWQLSCARALAVQTELLTPSDTATIGIPQGFVQVFMHGETSEFGDEAQNRRVTLFVPSVTPSEPRTTPEQPEAQSQAAAGEKESVYHATRDVLRDFLVGTTLDDLILARDHPTHVYGPDHQWTVELQGHPHIAQVRDNIYGVLVQYCKEKSSGQTLPENLPALGGRDDFNLNSLSFGRNAIWLFNDALNWLSWGQLGQKSAYLFGSFRLAWYAHAPTCNNGLGSTEVKFYAWDAAHVGSAIRVPMTNVPLIDIGDQPLGAGLPLNDVPIAWYWSTQYIFSY